MAEDGMFYKLKGLVVFLKFFACLFLSSRSVLYSNCQSVEQKRLSVCIAPVTMLGPHKRVTWFPGPGDNIELTLRRTTRLHNAVCGECQHCSESLVHLNTIGKILLGIVGSVSRPQQTPCMICQIKHSRAIRVNWQSSSASSCSLHNALSTVSPFLIQAVLFLL